MQRIDRGALAGARVPLCNLLALLPGKADVARPAGAIRPALMLAAHWDSRPHADRDPDPALRGRPVPGASDGASGVAILLELARILAADPPSYPIVLAFFDGEDLGEHFYGSRYFARWAGRRELLPWRPAHAIVVDMVGGRGMRCTRELNSLEAAPDLWARVQASARTLGLQEHFQGEPRRVTDDHVMLNRAGIPAVVLIDATYPFWHTAGDTPERCAAESLEIVGRVLEGMIRARVGAAAPAGASG